MKKSIVTIGIVLLACGIVLAACSGPEGTPAPDAKAPVGPAKAGDKAAAPAVAPAKAAAPAPAAAAPAGAALNAETLVGTSWKKGDATFSFEAAGALKVNGAIPGTWTIDGTTLNVAALGNTYKAEIKGDKILFEGTELEKVVK